ncbi:phosphatidate cytidylyltransferase [Anatilimnocola floriformis]|uniref:phosphatidate cytidylyltransferase n=1 Tax=Anatilimnocola floriformis TaxID=2948575 RepID=UPI0020C1ECC3|nr:phosphatidate cytidylyltransferase [Anatilimnocola floriformis]
MMLAADSSFTRLFDPRLAFDHPVTIGIFVFIAAGIVISGAAIYGAAAAGKLKAATATELKLRWQSWCVLLFAIAGPILLGAAYTIVAVVILSLLCYREYARAVGISGHFVINFIVFVCTLMAGFACFDHYDRLFFACGALGTGLIVVGTIHQDQPKGFNQRVALGLFGWLLFGYSLGYLGLMTNDPRFRPLLLTIILAVEMNDVFAYCCGKTFKGPKLLPTTSPGKTISGSVGAMVLTTILVGVLMHYLFRGTAVDHWSKLITLGVIISGLGQLGDLTLSSIKRDVGIKDFSAAIPGHGGFLDRFDSLVFVPPAVYHYLSLVLGPLGSDEPIRIFTGG